MCVFVERKKNQKTSFRSSTLEVRKASPLPGASQQRVAQGHGNILDRALTYSIFLWVAYFDPEYVI